MSKIRSLGNRELKQVLSLLERFSGDEFSYPVLERFRSLYLPFHKINQFLPLSLKFLPGIYVAVDDGKVLGLVWLSRDGHRRDRWKIDQVIINPDAYSAYDVGKQLMYYVINQFGAAGVETFLAYVDPHYAEGLTLLKDCGFRHCTKIHTFAMEQSGEEIKKRQVSIKGIREEKRCDARKLQELHSETLVPEVRVSLRKSPEDFCPNPFEKFAHRFQGDFFKRWVVAHGSQDYLHGSASYSTPDFKHFEVMLLISPAWEHGITDMLLFILQQIYKSAIHPRVIVHVYEFHKYKAEILEKEGFEKIGTTEVLVKDYWIPVKDREVQAKNPVLLFAKTGRTSPA